MDSSSCIPLWIVFAICVIGGAYFAATESSFSAANKIKIKALADDGNRRAKGVMYILNKFDKALTTLLVGNNVTKIAGASVFTLIATTVATEVYQKDEHYINSFAFSITFYDGTSKVYYVKTDAMTVGEALSGVGWISGEYGPYGLYVKTVDGETLDYDTHKKYWAFYVNGELSETGVDRTNITEGILYTFRAE